MRTTPTTAATLWRYENRGRRRLERREVVRSHVPLRKEESDQRRKSAQNRVKVDRGRDQRSALVPAQRSAHVLGLRSVLALEEERKDPALEEERKDPALEEERKDLALGQRSALVPEEGKGLALDRRSGLALEEEKGARAQRSARAREEARVVRAPRSARVPAADPSRRGANRRKEAPPRRNVEKSEKEMIARRPSSSRVFRGITQSIVNESLCDNL